jgi:hypothetical protein
VDEGYYGRLDRFGMGETTLNPKAIECPRAGRKMMQMVCHAVQDDKCPKCSQRNTWDFEPFWERTENKPKE